MGTMFAFDKIFKGFLLTAPLQELHEKYNKWGKDGY